MRVSSRAQGEHTGSSGCQQGMSVPGIQYPHLDTPASRGHHPSRDDIRSRLEHGPISLPSQNVHSTAKRGRPPFRLSNHAQQTYTQKSAGLIKDNIKGRKLNTRGSTLQTSFGRAFSALATSAHNEGSHLGHRLPGAAPERPTGRTRLFIAEPGSPTGRDIGRRAFCLRHVPRVRIVAEHPW